MAPDEDATFSILSLSIAEIFATESVPDALASSLATIFPDTTFLRASIRCGTGLFVTDNLLTPGHSMVSLVSLKYSLAGQAMKQAMPLAVRLPPGPAPFGGGKATQLVACAPVAVQPPAGAAYRALYVGSLLVGCPDTQPSATVKDALARLAAAAGPALLTIALPRVQHLGHLLSLRDADAEYIGAEEDLQDLPLEVSRPPQGAPTHTLKLQQQPPAAIFPAAAVSAKRQPSVQPPDTPRHSTEHGEEDGSQMSYRSAEEAPPVVPDAGKHATDADTGQAKPEQQQFRWGGGEHLFRHQSVSCSSKSLQAIASDEELPPHKQTDYHSNSKRSHSFADPAADAAAQMSLLLVFRASPALESHFITSEARTHALSDATFCGVYLAAMVCLFWAMAPVEHPQAWAAVLLAAVLPFCAASTALMGWTGWYTRSREAMLAMLMLTNVVVARRGGHLHGLPGTECPFTGPIGKLPCLVRSCDAVMALVLPLGCRVRFCWMVALQAVNMFGMVRAMPWQVLQADGCAGACAGALGMVGGILPLGLAYLSELRARRQMLRSL